MTCRALFIRTLGATLLSAGTLSATNTPSTVINIRGTAVSDDGVTTAYRAYQVPGTPYRILCPNPCTADGAAIDGLYTGFGLARQKVIALFGIDSLASNQPFDLHISDDHWCGTATQDLAGDSGPYLAYSTLSSGTFGCFWFTTPGHYAQPFQAQYTSTLAYQLLTSHEFTHTEFFTRHTSSYEDFAKAISFDVAGINGAPPITNPCDASLDVIGDGKLLWGLCNRNSFQYSDLATPFQSLNTLYTGHNGTAYAGTTSVYQFRKLLNTQLGSDTMDAFLASRMSTPGHAGDDGTLTSASGRVIALGGYLSLVLSANAVAANTNFHVEGPYVVNTAPPGAYTFDNAYLITKPDGSNVTFGAPVSLQIKYDRYGLPAGTNESAMKFYRATDNYGNAWTAVSGSSVDPAKMTAWASIPSTGLYALAAPTTTGPASWVIPLVYSQGSTKTQVALFNPSAYPIAGSLVYHPEGAAATAGDPQIPYSLPAWQVTVLPDIIASFGTTGGGTIDVVPSLAAAPDVSVRFIDSSASAPPDTILSALPVAAALQVGQHGILTAPPNSAEENFKFLVRTFASGATLVVKARNTSGALLATTTLTYAANTLFSVAPSAFANGATVTTNEVFDISPTAGSALVVTDTMESGTSSHNIQPATRIDSTASVANDVLHLPKAIELTNPDGSTSKLAMQLVNPYSVALAGKVVFKPASGGSSIYFNYSLAAYATNVYSDVLAGINQTGTGAVDIQSTSGPLPVSFARLVHLGNSTPFLVAPEAAQGAMEFLQAGDRTVLTAPASGAAGSFRIGVRTILKDLAMTIYVYSSAGGLETKLTKTIPTGTTSETDAATFVGHALTGNDTIAIYIDGGAGLVYGSTANPSTGAVNYQPGARLPYNF